MRFAESPNTFCITQHGKYQRGGKAATDHLSQLLSNLICIACNIIRGLGFVSGNVSKAL